jgi:hypothetical protein
MSTVDLIKHKIEADLQKLLAPYKGLPRNADMLQMIKQHFLLNARFQVDTSLVKHDMNKIQLEVIQNPQDPTEVLLTPMNMYTGLLMMGQWDYSPREVEANTEIEYEDEVRISTKLKLPYGNCYFSYWKEIPGQNLYHRKPEYEFKFYPNEPVQVISMTIPVES